MNYRVLLTNIAPIVLIIGAFLFFLNVTKFKKLQTLKDKNVSSNIFNTNVYFNFIIITFFIVIFTNLLGFLK